MVTPENMISVAAQHALQDMVELEMYVVPNRKRHLGRCFHVAARGRTMPGNRTAMWSSLAWRRNW